jgi:radical SAM superfamily enzyme YgiQ (UPF0313 family)
MRIQLIYPPIPGQGMSLDSFAWLAEPLGLEVLAAHAGDHDVLIQDLRFDGNLEGSMASFQPQLLGVTCHITETYQALDVCRRAKRLDPTVFTAVGGHFPTMLPQAFDYPCVDAVVMGEGEETFRELLVSLEKNQHWRHIPGLAFRENGRQVIGKSRELMRDLDILPIPRRDLVKRNRYNLFLDRPHAICEFTRGCANRCSFCSVHRFGRGKYRAMGVERILMELEGISEGTIAFIDDNFFHDLDRAERLAKEIKHSPLRKKRFFLFGSAELVVRRPEIMALWKEAGLCYFYLGIEGVGSLERFNKPVSAEENERAIGILNDLGVDLIVSIIVHPDFDREDFEAILEYIERNRIDYPLFPILTPFPGSQLYDEAFERVLTHNYALYDFLHSVFATRLQRRAFYEAYAGLYRFLGSRERRRRLRKRTLKRALQHYRPWQWPGLMLDAWGFLQKWRVLGKRLSDPEAYLQDDLMETRSFSREEAASDTSGSSLGRRSYMP